MEKYRKKPVEIEAFQYTGHLRDLCSRMGNRGI